MPNYVSNTFTIEGITKSEKLKIEEDIKKGNLFNSIIPEPNWLLIPNEDGDLPQEVQRDTFTYREWPNGSQDDRWYQWRCDHWGCKWPESDFILNEGNDECVDVIFNTAWSQPTEFTTALTKQYPHAKISNIFIEESDWFGGCIAFNGKALTWEFDKEKIVLEWLKENHPEIKCWGDIYEDEDVSEEFFEAEEDLYFAFIEKQFDAYKGSMFKAS